MSSSTLKIVAAVMVLFALLASAVAYRVAQNLNRQTQAAKAASAAARAESPKTLAVVAVQPLLAFEAITEDDIALVPVEVAPPSYFTEIESLLGKQPVIDVDVGAPITPRYFRGDSPLSRVIPEAHKALAVEVDDVIAVGGFVRPGDLVDVLLFARGAGSNATTQSRILLPDAEVLGFDTRIVDRPEGAESTQSSANAQANRRRVRTAVLAVPDADVPRFVLGANVGTLRLALHRARDDDASGLDADGLPLLMPDGAEILTSPDDRLEQDAPITLAELTRLKKTLDESDKPPPPPPPVYVYRGNALEAVRP